MGKIREYESEVTPHGPMQVREARDLDTGHVGDAVSQLGETIAGLGKQIHQQKVDTEITSAISQQANAQAQLSQAWDDTLMNPPGKTENLASNFMARYDETMGQISDNLETGEAQQHFARSNAAMREQFQQKTLKDQATLAGNDAVAGYNGVVSGLTTQLLRDPSAFQAALEQHEQLVNSLPISQEAKEELIDQGETQLAKAQYQGQLSINPQAALFNLKSKTWDSYFDSDELIQLKSMGDAWVRADAVAQKQKESIANAAADAQLEAQKDLSLKKLYSPQGLSVKEVLNNPAFDESTKEHFIKLIESSADAGGANKIKTNPAVMLNLFNRIHLPDGNPMKITDPTVVEKEFGKGNLNWTDMNNIRGEIKQAKDPFGSTESKLKANMLSTIEHKFKDANPMGMKDPEGGQNYQMFLSRFLPAYEAQRRAGKSPETLLSPDSPDYMGKLAQPYFRTSEQIMRSMFPETSPKPPTTANENASAPQLATGVTQTGAGTSSLSSQSLYKNGQIVHHKNGDFKFKGGDYKDKKNWEKVK